MVYPMPLPAAYAWLASSVRANNGSPFMIAEALKLYGIHEGLGVADNPQILQWAVEAGVSGYVHDAEPWCGLFMAIVAKRAGKLAPAKPLWALNWTQFGEASPVPSLGDVLVFERETPDHHPAGHVGLYVGQSYTAKFFHVLGGNESDQVNIVREPAERLRAVRRPIYRTLPANVRPVMLSDDGTSLSKSEA
jgi:uncharacterized protein (TIGR02594 family)